MSAVNSFNAREIAGVRDTSGASATPNCLIVKKKLTNQLAILGEFQHVLTDENVYYKYNKTFYYMIQR